MHHPEAWDFGYEGFFLLPLPFLGEDFGCEIYVSGCVIVLNIILTPTSILASDPIRLPADATDPRLVPEHASSLLPPQHPEDLSPLLLGSHMARPKYDSPGARDILLKCQKLYVSGIIKY